MSADSFIKKAVPHPTEIVREAIIVMAGAVLAAVVFQLTPSLKAWVAARLPTASPPDPATPQVLVVTPTPQQNAG